MFHQEPGVSNYSDTATTWSYGVSCFLHISSRKSNGICTSCYGRVVEFNFTKIFLLRAARFKQTLWKFRYSEKATKLSNNLSLVWRYYKKSGRLFQICVVISKYPNFFKVHTLGCIMFGLGQKMLSRLAWSKFQPILANQETLTDFHGNEAKKKKIKIKKNFKMAELKKLRFSKLPILETFLQKFHGLVLGLVVLIDAKALM